MYNYLKYRNYKAKEKAVLAGQANGVEMGDPNNRWVPNFNKL